MPDVSDQVSSTDIKLSTEAKRFGSFLLVGGTASALNLAIVGVLTLAAHWSYLPAALIAAEAGVLLSFVLNDRLTFRRLADSAGGWLMRCVRFHGAYAAGQVLTLAIAWSLNHFLAWIPLLSQALAIGIVLFFNFTVVRFWTYRSRERRARVTAVLPRARG
jgi:putative flippase GtrA